MALFGFFHRSFSSSPLAQLPYLPLFCPPSISHINRLPIFPFLAKSPWGLHTLRVITPLHFKTSPRAVTPLKKDVFLPVFLTTYLYASLNTPHSREVLLVSSNIVPLTPSREPIPLGRSPNFRSFVPIP